MKIFELLTRRADQGRSDALTYWTERHAALVRQRVGEGPLVRRYVNNVGLDAQPGPCVLPFDGVVGAWLDFDIAAFAANVNLAGNPVVADEPNFLACKPHLVLVEELLVEEPARRGLPKLLIFLRRAATAGMDAFSERLAEDLPEALRTVWGDELAGMTINAALPAEWGPWGVEWPIYDAVAEVWLTEVAARTVARGLAEFAEALTDFAPSPASLLAREVYQIDRLQR